MTSLPLILASRSRTRADMLERAGVAFDAQGAAVDEAAVKASMLAEKAPARDIADMLAELKARRVAARAPAGALVLGCDQVLSCEGRLFDKAETIEEARAHLLALRGRSHQLLSAAVIFQDAAPVWRHVGAARLSMRQFSEQFVDEYLYETRNTVLTSVGCYQIEGRGAQLFSRISGDYFTILGMPLLEILEFLRQRGVLQP